jgi:hypothetical protein
MKALLLINFLFSVTALFAQIEIPEYDLDVAEGVDSIVVESVDNNGYNFWKDVSYYSNNRRIRLNTFDSLGLFSYKTFHFKKRGDRIIEGYFGKSSKFDPEKNGWIEFWDPANCALTIKQFLDGKLGERLLGRVNGVDTVIDQITFYDYDENDKLRKEVTRDQFVGWVGTFKSNSTELKNMEEKNQTETYTRIFSYEKARVEIIYVVDHTITGKETIFLDAKGHVTSMKMWSDTNLLLSETTAVYDEKGRMKTKTWKSYSSTSVWGVETDVVADGQETIEYDRLGRPLTVKTVYSGNIVRNTSYRYY